MSNPKKQIKLEIYINSNHSELLKGLDMWLNLGLISDRQVKQISGFYLTCKVPEFVTIKTPQKTNKSETINKENITLTIPPKKERILVTLWHRFRDELSVRWLLFLGVFLVVISSGILAASQWNQVADWVQYLILFIYTIGFWGASNWAKKKQNLALTAKTLQTISFLLIPINFWAIDTFIWDGNFINFVLGLTSILILSYLYFKETSTYNNFPLIINYLILSFLQLGWQVNNFLWLGIYGGLISSGITFFLAKSKTSVSFVVFGFSAILIRAIFVENLPLTELGLVIGICGYILTEVSFYQSDEKNNLNPNQFIASIAEKGGIFLLFFGWLISLKNNIWQGIIISGLSLYFFYKRLITYWLKRDVLAIFIIGFQTYLLIKNLIPPSTRLSIYNLLIDLTQANKFPFSLLSISLFTYVIIWVICTNFLYKKNKPKLALFAEYLTIILCLNLTLISLINPFLRSINLLLTSCTFIYIAYRNQTLRKPLIYLSHFYILSTFTAIIAYVFPSLNYQQWAIFFVVLMTGEFCINYQKESESNWWKIWHQSCFYFSLILASISYLLFWYQLEILYFQNDGFSYLNSLWLLTPLSLTMIASKSEKNRKNLTVSLSCISLILVQALTISHPTMRLISLTIATLLMIVNTYYLSEELLAILNFFFLFSLEIAFLWDKILVETWFLVWAINIFILWLFPIIFKNTENKLLKLYVKVANNSAITITSLELIIITIEYLVKTPLIPQWQLMLSSILIATIMIIRYKKELNYGAVYGVSWAIEICLIESLLLLEATRIQVAFANIGLGLFALFLVNKFKDSPYLNLLSIAPLIYATMAIYLRIGHFNNYTGLITFGAAIIGIGVGYLRQNNNKITYISIAGISLATYELLIYQILQNPDRNIIDACILLAIINALFAFGYRLFAWYLHLKNKKTFLKIPRFQIHLIAHIHWAFATLLRGFSAVLPNAIYLSYEPKLTPIGLVVSLLLAVYGILQSRDMDLDETDENATKYKEIWVYLGITEIFTTLIYTQLIFRQVPSLDTYSMIIFIVFALAIYQIPWETFGLKVKPWQKASTAIPMLMTLITWENISFISLIMVAFFYIQTAIRQKNIRWTYFSVLLIDYAIGRWLLENQINEILWYAILVGLFFIYIAQIDPLLKNPPRNKQRHFCRLLGSGIICLFAVFFHQQTPLIPAVICLVFLITGLATQIRAFLWMGTINFVLTVSYQSLVLMFNYSFLKWIIGIISGITLIAIAANFEQNKEKFNQVLQNYLAQLQQWE